MEQFYVLSGTVSSALNVSDTVRLLIHIDHDDQIEILVKGTRAQRIEIDDPVVRRLPFADDPIASLQSNLLQRFIEEQLPKNTFYSKMMPNPLFLSIATVAYEQCCIHHRLTGEVIRFKLHRELMDILSNEVYKDGCQYDYEDGLKEAIEFSWDNTSDATLESVASFMPKRCITTTDKK